MPGDESRRSLSNVEDTGPGTPGHAHAAYQHKPVGVLLPQALRRRRCQSVPVAAAAVTAPPSRAAGEPVAAWGSRDLKNNGRTQAAMIILSTVGKVPDK